jgi:hypothetical protein
VLQGSYDKLKEGGEKSAQKISESEVDELLYVQSEQVLELEPETLQALILNK